VQVLKFKNLKTNIKQPSLKYKIKYHNMSDFTGICFDLELYSGFRSFRESKITKSMNFIVLLAIVTITNAVPKFRFCQNKGLKLYLRQ
jgi:hypothetical protein